MEDSVHVLYMDKKGQQRVLMALYGELKLTGKDNFVNRFFWQFALALSHALSGNTSLWKYLSKVTGAQTATFTHLLTHTSTVFGAFGQLADFIQKHRILNPVSTITDLGKAILKFITQIRVLLSNKVFGCGCGLCSTVVWE